MGIFGSIYIILLCSRPCQSIYTLRVLTCARSRVSSYRFIIRFSAVREIRTRRCTRAEEEAGVVWTSRDRSPRQQTHNNNIYNLFAPQQAPSPPQRPHWRLVRMLRIWTRSRRGFGRFTSPPERMSPHVRHLSPVHRPKTAPPTDGVFSTLGSISRRWHFHQRCYFICVQHRPSLSAAADVTTTTTLSAPVICII